MKNFTQKFIGLLALVFTISFTANSQEIGDIYQGGIVFYVDETGLHGLVADMQNLEPLTWGCMATSLDGAGGQAMGTGYQNTLDIVAGCSEIPIAASEALAYESEGYSDWYLPSQDELIEIYNTIGPGGPEGDIAGFGHSGEETLNWYWSSSESNMFNAWRVYFGNGLTYVGDKNLAYKVRVIRSVTFEAEVPGCTDPDALNYDSTATQATACFYDCTDAVAMDGSASSSTGENSWHSFDIAADGSALVSLDTDFDFPENISISLFADCEGTYVSCAGTELVDDLIWACEGDFAAGTYYVNVTSYPLELGSADYTLSVSMSIEGCTDAVAVNYDATATVDDGSCILPVYGCTGPSHCNYNPDATVDDGSCVYAMEGYDCDGNCLLEVDCMGECGGSAIEDECGECGGNGLDSPDITNGLCDCEGNQWEEYCYDNDGDGLGDISTVAWFCPSSIEDGYILNCDDTDDTFGCTDIIVNVINSDSTSYHSFGMSIEDENGVFDYLGFGQRNYCIEPGCFAFYIYDTNDSIGGFEHVQLLVTDINNTIYLDHSFGVSNSEIINFSYGDVDCSYGCTSIFASNYNPEATVNDGSCEYENDNCTDGQISDCNENCTPSTWYSDGWCDDGAYSFGGNYIDLTCFDNDGGDCEEITDDSILGTWEIFSWYEEGEEVLNEDFNGYFNFNDSGEFTLTVINEEEGYFIDQGVYEITGDTLMILPDSHDEDESLYFSFDLENGELSMFGINVDIAIQMSSTETIWSCIDPNNPNYHPEANMMDYTCIEGCFDENACNYGEEEDCYYPEGDCDCEGDGVDYSNVGFEVNMDGMELSDSSYVYISGFWHDSTSTSDIHIELGHGWDNVYVGDYDGPPGASFSYYVVVDGQQYGNCDGNAYSIGFPDLDQEHPCWVHNNTNWIEPFNCGEITDCNGPQYTGQQWIDQAEYLIGDGNCDSEDGWSFNFNCDEFDFEGGDCLDISYCEEQGLSYVSAGGGDWPEEVMWILTDCEDNIVADGGAPFASCMDLPENLIVKMWDSYGDGWQGNQLTINNESYTLITGGYAQALYGVCGTPGCTFENADNYNIEATVDDNSCEWSCPLTYGGVPVDSTLCYQEVWTLGYSIEEVESWGWDCSCVEQPTGCTNQYACNYLEEEDCYYPEGDCDCEGDGVDYSNVGFEVNMDGMELSDSSYVYISGFWHDSTSTSDIHIELGHGWDNVYVGDYDGPPGASFSYYVVVDGQQYGNCDGNAYSIGFPDLDQEHPCWVHNNTNWIEPFNCGEITDCNGPQYTGQQWIDQAEYLIGDGNCDSEDGWSFNFNCDEFDFEGGDCINDNDCSDAYNDGWNNGEENGWNNGYDVGYAEGYNNGEDDLDAANEALAGAQYSAEYFAEMYLVADSIAEAIASDLAATQDSLAATQAALGNYNLLQGELAAANAVAADLEAQLVAAQEACEPIFIDLLEGWNMIGYTLSEEQDVAATLEDISSELILVKNNEGDIYWLEFGFNGIGNFIPGQGYQAKLISSIPNYTYLIVGDQKLELTPQVPQWVFDIEVDVHPNDVRTLVRVVNMLGQEVDPENQTRGTVLLYLYNDATVEKKMIN